MSEKFRESEEEGANIYGRKVPLSGAGDLKGDIIGEGVYSELVIENKFTEKSSYSLKLETLNKARREAKQHLKHPALRLDFNGEVFIIVPEKYFRRLHEHRHQET